MGGMTQASDNGIALAIETSGRVGSVALGRGAELLAVATFQTTHGHGVELLPTADRLCREAGLSPDVVGQVYVSGGPGSFTGLRIGITFAKAMSMAVGAAVVRVPTLDVIAQNALGMDVRPSRVVVVLDAKRRRIYTATFTLESDRYLPVDEAAERDPTQYLPGLGPVAALGEGIPYHAPAVQAADNVTVLPDSLSRARAEVVFELGRQAAAAQQFISIDELTPIYIRRPEAEEKWEARQAADEA